MLDRHCTRRRGLYLAILALAILVAAPSADAQTVIEGYQVTLSRFGGDATLPPNLGFLCFWDDGIWTMTDYIDAGYFVWVGRKTYLIGGVEGEEHMSMVFRKRKGDLVLGAPANSTELPGQDVLIVAAAKLTRRDAGCVSRTARTSATLLSKATPRADRAAKAEIR
ncbi:MAG: hypothetical protein GKS06_12395 [Acidobacteria bacterium]|nr:hypothetical protein [Acidobacteriota bacterium]